MMRTRQIDLRHRLPTERGPKSGRSSGLLVSVQNLDEARAAVAGGAQVVDVKDPTAGALGRSSPGVWRSIAAETPADTILSVALGEASDFVDNTRLVNEILLPPQFQFAKMGLAGLGNCSDWSKIVHDVRQSLAQASGNWPAWVAVSYADWQEAAAPTPAAILDDAIQQNCAGFLIDTQTKDGRSVFSWVSPEVVTNLFVTARQQGLFCALAGSLKPPEFPLAATTSPDLIAVRGAACDGGRQGMVTEANVRRLVETLNLQPSSSPERR